MTVPFWCLLVAILLPYVWSFAKIPYLNELGGPDNKAPRAQAAKLTGKGARLVAAQANAWEALGIFAPAVLVNHVAGGNPQTASVTCGIWVVARVLHGLFYMQDIDKGRSAVFLVGLVCVIALFVQAAMA